MEGGDVMNEIPNLPPGLRVVVQGDVEANQAWVDLWVRVLVAMREGMPEDAASFEEAFREPNVQGLLVRLLQDAGATRASGPERVGSWNYGLHVHYGDDEKAFVLLSDSVECPALQPPIGQGHNLLFNVTRQLLSRPRIPGLFGVVCIRRRQPGEPVETLLTAQNPQARDGVAVETVLWANLSTSATSPGLTVLVGLDLHGNAARLASLRLQNTGPAPSLTLADIAPRVNVITGDNGLGKSFLLEAVWWMLTGRWHMLPAVVTDQWQPAAISAQLREGAAKETRSSPWDRMMQGWGPPLKDASLRPGLVVYARVDGSFSVWDSHRNVYSARQRDGYTPPPPAVYPFSYAEVMYGLKVWLDDKNELEVSIGLINEWREWQTGNKPQFALLQSILATLGPDGETLTSGTPSRPYLDDARDMPTIKTGYGQEVPILLAPAGVKRAAMFAYVLTWAISEHRRLVNAQGGVPARSVVLLIDEPETHLHPRWQRTILPSLLKALEVGFGEPKVDVQMFVATHSPLVLASLEPHFDPAQDALWKLDLVNGEVKLERDRWYKRGTAGAWLTSDVFDLGDARSREAEQALNEARELIRARVNDPERLAAVTARLVQVLPEDDPMLTRWQAFVEDVEVGR
jgi:hypothetical protein